MCKAKRSTEYLASHVFTWDFLKLFYSQVEFSRMYSQYYNKNRTNNDQENLTKLSFEEEKEIPAPAIISFDRCDIHMYALQDTFEATQESLVKPIRLNWNRGLQKQQPQNSSNSSTVVVVVVIS